VYVYIYSLRLKDWIIHKPGREKVSWCKSWPTMGFLYDYRFKWRASERCVESETWSKWFC